MKKKSVFLGQVAQKLQLNLYIYEKNKASSLTRLYMGWVEGVEPSIFGTTIRRFNQLSHTHHICWHATQDSNL